jgi:hypothetical protein
MAATYMSKELMKFMGHADLQTVNRYVKLRPHPGEDDAAARLKDFLRRSGRELIPSASISRCAWRRAGLPGADRVVSVRHSRIPGAPTSCNSGPRRLICRPGGGGRAPDAWKSGRDAAPHCVTAGLYFAPGSDPGLTRAGASGTRGAVGDGSGTVASSAA